MKKVFLLTALLTSLNLSSMTEPKLYADTLKSDLDWARSMIDDDADDYSLLHIAAIWGKTELAKLLIDAGADVNAKDKYDETPLFKTAIFGNTELANLLIDAGADLNARESGYGDTPLHRAIVSEKTELVNLLIDAGANINAQNASGLTPLDYAKGVGNQEIANLLESKLK